MTLRHLLISRTVCETGSVTAAADRLNMSQPAVSIALRELETFYQTRLFERMNRRIYPTESADTLLQYASTILSQFEESTDAIRGEAMACHVRLGVNVTLAEAHLAGWMKEMNSRIPGIEMNVTVNSTQMIEKLLHDNRIDMAAVDELSDEKKYIKKLIYTEKMSVLCAPALFVGQSCIQELAEKPLLLREKGSGNRGIVDAAFLRHGLQAKPLAESSSTLALLQMGRAALGYVILPRSIAAGELGKGALREVRVTDDSFERHYFLIYHHNKHLTLAMTQVADILLSGMRKS